MCVAAVGRCVRLPPRVRVPQIVILNDVVSHFFAPSFHEALLTLLYYLCLNLFLPVHAEVDQQYYDYYDHDDAAASDVHESQIGIALNYSHSKVRVRVRLPRVKLVYTKIDEKQLTCHIFLNEVDTFEGAPGVGRFPIFVPEFERKTTLAIGRVLFDRHEDRIREACLDLRDFGQFQLIDRR